MITFGGVTWDAKLTLAYCYIWTVTRIKDDAETEIDQKFNLIEDILNKNI